MTKEQRRHRVKEKDKYVKLLKNLKKETYYGA